MSYKTQFPCCNWLPRPVVAALEAAGFTDNSWGNDACPRFTSDDDLDVWCEAKVPTLREGQKDRYCVVQANGNVAFRFERSADLIEWLTVRRARNEILADIASGRVPETVVSFSELHDYVDANGYGGAFERFHPADNAFWNRVQNYLDVWLKAGRPCVI